MWAFVLAALLLVEVGVRLVEPRLSLDIQHIEDIPRIAADLDESAGPTLLFFGNSLTREGVDLGVVADGMASVGVGADGIAAIYPDDTTILDWVYVYDRFLARANHAPDVLVLGFALGHLEDADVRPTQTYRLGRHFTTWGSLRELFANDVRRSEDRLDVVLAKLSRAFANRERISRRVLAALPGYAASADRINAALQEAADVPRAQAPTPTYTMLTRFLRNAAEHGTRVVVVAMPIRSPYGLDARLPEVVAANGATFLDARQVPGLEPSSFRDGLHLTEQGAELYSAYLASRLAPWLTEGNAGSP